MLASLILVVVPVAALLVYVQGSRKKPEIETQVNMNINHMRLDRNPRFAEGWKPILDALRGGRYFVNTGEVLIPEFTADGKYSGSVSICPILKILGCRK